MTVFHPEVMTHGLATGALYGLAATGTQLILGCTGKVHLGLGHILVAAALCVASGAGETRIPLVGAMAVVPLATALLAYVSHPRALWRRLQGDGGERACFMITFGGALALEAVSQWLWPLPATGCFAAGTPFSVLGISFVWPKALALVVSLCAALGLWCSLRNTRWGKAMRAWDGGSGEIEIVGVDPQGLGRLVTSLGLGLAAVGGALVGATQVISAQDGIGWTIKALCLAMLGGGLAPFRTMAFGWALGLAEAWVSQSLGPQWHTAVAPALLPGVLLWRSRRET